MKQLILFLTSLILLKISIFAQGEPRINDSLFLNGISLLNPNYIFKWQTSDLDFLDKSFANVIVTKKMKDRVIHVRFDSALFMNDIWVDQVIIKYRKKKSEARYKMVEFIGIVNKIALERLTIFFHYQWKGWITYPKQKPIYLFKLFKTKKGGAIVINAT